MGQVTSKNFLTAYANMEMCTLMLVCTQLKLKSYFKVHAFILSKFSTCEGSSLPMKHDKKNIGSIFLTINAMILDTHGSKKLTWVNLI